MNIDTVDGLADGGVSVYIPISDALIRDAVNVSIVADMAAQYAADAARKCVKTRRWELQKEEEG